MAIDQNGIITMYKVHYQAIAGKVSEERAINVTERSVNLTELHNFTSYRISVGAYNRAGVGPFSAGITVAPGKEEDRDL